MIEKRLQFYWRKVVFYLSIVVLTLLIWGCAKPPQESLLARVALCESIGRAGLEQELCALEITNYAPYYQATRVYLVSEFSIQEVESLSGGFGIHEMLVSPSRRYLAIVENAGEGHPELGVCSLEGLLHNEDQACFAGFNPYPGGVYDLEWQGNVLNFSSETPEDIDEEGESEGYWQYALDAKSGKLQRVGKSIK